MIDTAVLLAAGQGSRLRSAAPYKPLCPVAGRPLIDHALEGLADAGLSRVVVTLGYGGDAVRRHLEAGEWRLTVDTVPVEDWTAPNGVSLLAAASRLRGGEAVLAMCDHLVDPALYGRLAACGAGAGLHLGIDRRLGHDWVDADDVTRVALSGDTIVAIGKGIDPYDAYDTGVFAVGPALYDALAALPNPSLSEGVARLSRSGGAKVVDCSDLDWIDVDDAAALAKAEAWQRSLAGRYAALA